MRTVLVLAYPGCQLLDLTGPISVFCEAEAIAPGSYEILVASPEGGLIRTRGGIAIDTMPLDPIDIAGVDTLLVPGADRPELGRFVADEASRIWARRAVPRCRRVTSVCTGAFVLASWGLLDGRRAATHWQAAAQLSRLYPSVQVDPSALYVEDEGVWTSAGVSTGIDMTLALVEEDLGRDVAHLVARRLVLQMRRPGTQSQYSSLLEAQSGSYSDLVVWMRDNPAADLSVEALAAKAAQAPRTFHRRFRSEMGMAPAAFVERMRCELARAMLEGNRSLKQIAVATGFGSLDRLGRAFRRHFGVSPSVLRTLHHGGSRHDDATSAKL